eukprot:TRINITY_DN13977_c0_g1_i1.p1 TRINITY_DN13977_c0_g1~~TRINITY_DN13977_c0_g1_i1.p1  ORF type:complete len:182 (+),score=2.93 TRINITY_DN13977_c0_g1_i1:58-603(+)
MKAVGVVVGLLCLCFYCVSASTTPSSSSSSSASPSQEASNWLDFWNVSSRIITEPGFVNREGSTFILSLLIDVNHSPTTGCTRRNFTLGLEFDPSLEYVSSTAQSVNITDVCRATSQKLCLVGFESRLYSDNELELNVTFKILTSALRNISFNITGAFVYAPVKIGSYNGNCHLSVGRGTG